MNATYARGGQQRMTAGGGVIIGIISLLCAVLVIAGFYYAAGTGERHKIGLAAAGCEPNLSPNGLPCTTWQTLSSQYVKMTTPVTQQLNADAAAYTANEGDNLAAAEVAVTAEVTSEHALDASLAQFPFPPAVAPVAKKLVEANDALAKLTAEQARSTSLILLTSFNAQVQAASAVVQTDMELVSKALAKPPTVNQEP